MLAALAVVAFAVTGCAIHAARAAESTSAGDNGGHVVVENRTSLGKGYVQTVYRLAGNHAPVMIGITVSDSAMQTMPITPAHDGTTCFDVNGDGTVDPDKECGSGHERVLWFPDVDGLPFKWMLFNWQPRGHGPAHIFDKPHFDLHFFIQDYYARNAIRTGPCPAVLLNCDDFEKAKKPVPDPFNPIGFGAPGAAGRMGNHIADLNAPPFTPGPFTQAFVYGTYDAHITFWETVFATDWLKTARPQQDCIALKWAPQVEQSGYYPHKSCVRYRSAQKDFLMSLEDFAYRTAPGATLPSSGAPYPGTSPSVPAHSH
jgi:hypothetical protein